MEFYIEWMVGLQKFALSCMSLLGGGGIDDRTKSSGGHFPKPKGLVGQSPVESGSLQLRPSEGS